jgi:glycosyltransferase involved in cell wall biosynthesis
MKRIDIVYAVSPPLTTARLGLYMSKRLKAKFIMEVSDAWPDVLIEMGFFKNPLLKCLLKKVALRCYKDASTIIALTRGIQTNIREKIPEQKDKVILVTNGVNPDLFTLDDEAKREIEELKKKFNPGNKFVCFYFGAHSLNNALFTIIETARLLKSEPGILFILLGGGDKKEQLQQLAKEYGLENILFLPPVPRNKSPIWLQLADIFLLPYLKGKFFRMNLPNKFFDYLASAKPIILAGEGETADIISKSDSGKIVKAEDFKAMAHAILEFKSMPLDERIKMGENGRKYVFEHFSRSQLTKKLIHVLSQAENGRKEIL